MKLHCTHCNSSNIGVKNEKVALTALGAAVTGPLAVMLGLKAGLIAIIVAAFQGNRNASNLLRMKMQLMQASSKVGSFFYCKSCSKDISVSDAFNQITSN